MCDHYLGKVLDYMDKYRLWDDTMLIVNTDHGFLLGEHGWWSKSIMPFYEEISHTPLFIHDPRFKGCDGQWRNALTQTIDLAPTVLDFFGLEIPDSMQGHSLKPVIEKNEAIREYALFGDHEGHTNLTDGRYVYMRAPLEGKPFYEYTLMPTHMAKRFTVDELKNLELSDGFSFTQGVKVLKIKANEGMNHLANFGTKLFDLKNDPKQESPIIDYELETKLANELLKLMRADECPDERFERFGLPVTGEMTIADIESFHSLEDTQNVPAAMEDFKWQRGAANMYATIARFLPPEAMEGMNVFLRGRKADGEITVEDMMAAINEIIPKENQMMILYFGMLASRTV